MATTKQRTAAKRNIKKAATAAKKKRTIANLPKSTRTALGKQAKSGEEVEPVLLDVHMEKSPSAQAGKLLITAQLRPGKLGRHGDPHEWRTWCEKKLMDLSSYLIAKRVED